MRETQICNPDMSAVIHNTVTITEGLVKLFAAVAGV